MTDDRSTDQIEREIELERVELARSLESLQRQFSPEVIVDRVSGMLRDNGGEFAGTALKQARDNPLALAVTGVGLAWLIAGPARKQTRIRERPMPVRPLSTFDDESHDVHLERHEPEVGYDHRDYQQVRGFRHAESSTEGFDTRVATAEGDVYDPVIRARGETESSYLERIRGMASDVRDSISSWMHSSETTAADGGKSLRERLMEGTENMTDTARDRVIAAREAAWDAERRLEARARDYAASGKDAFNQQPLIGALVAFGIGAMIGAALPRTRKEDEYLGVYRDRALSEAERIYRAESAKLRAVAEAAAREAKAVATETLEEVKSGTPSGNEAVSAVEDKAKSAADRIKDAAADEADKRDLGSSVS